MKFELEISKEEIQELKEKLIEVEAYCETDIQVLEESFSKVDLGLYGEVDLETLKIKEIKEDE